MKKYMIGFVNDTINAQNMDDMLIDADTINANRMVDIIIDAETITADRYDDLVKFSDTGNDTLERSSGDDEIHYKDELTILIQDGKETLYLTDGGSSNDTINADGANDELLELRGFGETPPLDLTYEFEELGDYGDTPIDAMTYILET
ncbi:MAG: hypothetical protein AAF557_12585 [Pseudomonadota bacterium]